MPQVEVDGLTINYNVQGEGEPLLLIPYTSADHACYAFQLPAYTEHFSCIAVDLPGSGESDKPTGPYSTEGYADQVAAFLATIGIEQAHVAGMVIQAIFPWCFTPEMYVERPQFVDTLVAFVRGRPAQPLDAFLAQTDAVLAHDASAALREIDVPTLITFGARDLVCSTRFAEPLRRGIAGSELVVFEHLSHAGLHEDPETFNRATLDFLLRQRL